MNSYPFTESRGCLSYSPQTHREKQSIWRQTLTRCWNNWRLLYITLTLRKPLSLYFYCWHFTGSDRSSAQKSSICTCHSWQAQRSEQKFSHCGNNSKSVNFLFLSFSAHVCNSEQELYKLWKLSQLRQIQNSQLLLRHCMSCSKAEVIISERKAYLSRIISPLIYILFPPDKTQLVSSFSF